ncbi:MAG TPA: hypothetical protein VJ508_16800, partial [Saprospiraceae bacterium]|nr:hypothetical protein [Saprospiraceae bacterium]
CIILLVYNSCFIEWAWPMLAETQFSPQGAVHGWCNKIAYILNRYATVMLYATRTQFFPLIIFTY